MSLFDELFTKEDIDTAKLPWSRLIAKVPRTDFVVVQVSERTFIVACYAGGTHDYTDKLSNDETALSFRVVSKPMSYHNACKLANRLIFLLKERNTE